MNSECFNEKAESMLLDFLNFYSPLFTVTRDFMLSDTKLNALAEYHSREEKSIFGMKLNQLGTESNEYGMYFFIEDFTPMHLEQIQKLMETAEQALVKLHPVHGLSILSLIILTGNTFEGTAAALKKYRLWKNYNRMGQLMGRVVVININANDSSILCSKDAKDLKNLLKNALLGKKLQ